MKAACFRRGGKFEVQETPEPAVGRADVLVRVSYCGICGSDLHLVDAGLLPPNCIIGHELSGRVARVGSEVTDWHEGDRVVVMPVDPCGACGPCMNGDTQLCIQGMSRAYGLGMLPGGFAESMLVKPSMLVKIPEGLDHRTAALNEPWAVAAHAVNRLRLTPDSRVAVMGAGPIGLLTVYALKQKGVKKIFVSEPDPFRADQARRAGATEVFNPKECSLATVLPKAAGGAPEVVIDAVGNKTSTQEAAALAGPNAMVLVLGVHLGQIPITPIVAFAKELSFIFSLGYRADEFAAGPAQMAAGVLDPQVIVSDVLPLARIGDAFDLLHQSGHTKVLIDCRQLINGERETS